MSENANYSFEDLGKNLVKVRMEVSAADFKAAIAKVYEKKKGRMNVPGFRKGHAPLSLIEKTYGKDVFYEDAVNEVLPKAYSEAVEELKLDVMSRPAIDLDTIEEEKPVVLYATVAVRPEVGLPKYKSMKVASKAISITDEDINKELQSVAERNSRLVEVEGAAEKDNTVNIDYEGFVDGVAFNGGKDQGYDLKLGSGAFIPGFEDQLIGAKAGDEVDVKVTFPTEYHAKDLAGKEALFKVKVNRVSRTEIPALDDDFAQDVSDCDTLDAYKEQLKKDITDRRQKEADNERTKAIMDKIIEKAVIEIPDAIVDTRCEYMAEDMAQNMRYQGLSIEQYLQYTKQTYEQFLATLRPDALRNVQQELILGQIAKEEAITVTDEDWDNELKRMAEMYRMEVDKLKPMISADDEESIKTNLLHKKAQEYLLSVVK